MLEFKEKQKVRKIKYSKPALFLLSVFFLLSLEGLWHIYEKHSEALEKAEEAQGDLRDLQKREAGLEKKVVFLKTEKGKDEEVRKKFMVGREGEGVILVVDPIHSGEPPNPSPEKKPSVWTGFLNFFR
jgi:hypothetical protein